jgi:hypothetical protein
VAELIEAAEGKFLVAEARRLSDAAAKIARRAMHAAAEDLRSALNRAAAAGASLEFRDVNLDEPCEAHTPGMYARIAFGEELEDEGEIAIDDGPATGRLSVR